VVDKDHDMAGGWRDLDRFQSDWPCLDRLHIRRRRCVEVADLHLLALDDQLEVLALEAIDGMAGFVGHKDLDIDHIDPNTVHENPVGWRRLLGHGEDGYETDRCERKVMKFRHNQYDTSTDPVAIWRTEVARIADQGGSMRQYAKSLAVGVVIGTLCFGCSQQVTEPDLDQQLQLILNAEVQENDAVRSAALHVDAPALGLNWDGAAGMADPENGIHLGCLGCHPSRVPPFALTHCGDRLLRFFGRGSRV
jgi:hypothetical protein